MTDTAISPLRRRMIEDMTIRQFRSTTQHTYVRFVKEFSIFFGRSPDKAAFEDVRRYQLHLTSRGVSPGSINGAMTALRFFSGSQYNGSTLPTIFRWCGNRGGYRWS